MKKFANIEARSLKIRGVFRDGLVTDGGFYSGQLGEVAYKTDVPSASYFYGMTVKTSTDARSFSGINVISFDEHDFYLTQPDDNNVKVELRREATLATRSGESDVAYDRAFNLKSTTPENFKFYFRYVIPANKLTKGRVVRATILGTARWTGTTTSYTNLLLDGKKVYDSSRTAFGTSTLLLARLDQLYFCQTSPTTLQVIIKAEDGPRVSTSEFGDLASDVTGTRQICHTGELESSQAVERVLEFYSTFNSAFTGFMDRYFSKIEYLN
jgi:hypothetical protein